MFSVISWLTCFSRSSILPLAAPTASPPAARIVPSVLRTATWSGAIPGTAAATICRIAAAEGISDVSARMTTEAEGG